MQINMRKEKIKLGVLVVAILMLVVSVSYAFFEILAGQPALTDVDVATDLNESFIFTPGTPLSMKANIDNFSSADGSLSASTTSTATLRASSETGSASEEYFVYFNITNNDFVYTVDENTPELLLTITGPDGEVKTIDGLNYKTVTDAKSGDEIGGFDVTTHNGFVEVKTNQAISTTTEVTQEWTVKLTFVNLNTSQMDNEGKIFDSNLYLREDEMFYITEGILADHGGAAAIEAKGTPNFSVVATNDQEMFAAPDDYGTSYYYRGAVDNNWVYFAGFYWRIIRINGDGSVRMIYTGSTAPTESQKVVMTGEGTTIGSTNYNSSSNNNAYVGYMYTLNQRQGNSYNSVAKTYIDNWYRTNLLSHSEYIADSIFCNDRSITSGSGIGTVGTTYGAYNRLNSDYEPTLICPEKLDRFTVNETIVGNARLTYPIGLLTIDEISIAGSLNNNSNSKFYLYNALNYYTMSPNQYSPTSSMSVLFRINSVGQISTSSSNQVNYYRPVISLKNTIISTGMGTWDNPYKITE